MTSLIPSISPEVDAILQKQDFPDDLERVLRLEEAVSSELSTLKDRRSHALLEAQERENKRQKAEAELAAILARDAETQRLMADLAAQKLQLMSVIESEETMLDTTTT